MSDRRTTALTPDETERVVAALRRLIERYQGSQSALSRAHPALKQRYLSKILRGVAVPGWAFVRDLAEALRTSPEALVGGEARIDRVAGDDGGAFAGLDGWRSAESEARRRWPYVPAEAWAGARTLRGRSVPHVTPEAVRALADAWIALYATPPEPPPTDADRALERAIEAAAKRKRPGR